MCGIAGIMAPAMSSNLLGSTLGTMMNDLRHRGPDDAGSYVEPGLAIGMRRLSIIDLEHGRQPMFSADGQTMVVSNGEIYNFPELKKELMACGHLFQTRCDTEVILHGYRQWKEKVVDHLHGMFAFCIYDRLTRSLFLARDHFGIKPLYYFTGNGIFSFCSEPLPLLRLPGMLRRLNEEALEMFLAHKYVPAPLTLIDGMKKLEPGACMRVDENGKVLASQPYWHLEHVPLEMDASEAEEKLRTLLIESVRRQMLSDVPVGLFLSGGIDSGLLLWAMRQSMGADHVSAYTVGFDCASYDESPLAAVTAQHLGARHHVDYMPAPEASELDRMIELFGEPFANLSVPANFLVSRAAGRHVKVALNGSGADELFGGYDRYYAVQPPWALTVVSVLSPLLRPFVRRLPVEARKGSLVSKARHFLEVPNGTPASRHAWATCLFSPGEMKLLAPRLRPSTDFVVHRYASAPGRDALQRAIWTDVTTMMADDYLLLIDRTSMAASLEVRVPFLDLELAQFGFSLPSAMKINGWEKKSILRRLARECLPAEIVRAPKRGFESPVSQWFLGRLGNRLAEIVRDGPMAGVLDARYVDRLLMEHRTRHRDVSKQLLGLYTLSYWANKYGISV